MTSVLKTRSDGVAVALRRAASVEGNGGDAAAPPVPMPGWLRRTLGVALSAKLVGAHLLVAALAAVALRYTSASRQEVLLVFGALLLALAANWLLVHVALRPVWALERVAGRVWGGDLAARVGTDPVADRHMTRVGRTFNLLLDSLADDRERMRALALQAVRAQDDERSRIARELHDSTAQAIAALTYQLAALARDAADAGDDAQRDRLLALRAQTGDVLEEVRLLAQSIHPRVLDDLGLAPALAWLARRTHEHSGLDVEVDDRLDDRADAMSDVTAAALYRVAQESLRNVERHAGAASAWVRLWRDGDDVVLEVTDDGRGFDLAEAERRRPGMGLFSMRERIGLVGGTFAVETASGGTTVRARAPLAFAGPHAAQARTTPFMPPPSSKHPLR